MFCVNNEKNFNSYHNKDFLTSYFVYDVLCMPLGHFFAEGLRKHSLDESHIVYLSGHSSHSEFRAN